MAFWDRLDEIARELSGAHHSSWNGRTETVFREFTGAQINHDHTTFTRPPDPRDPANGEPERRRSAVQWTGTIRLDQERVVLPLDDMLDHANDAEFGDADLVSWKTALRARLQAHGHLLSPEGEDYANGQLVNRHGWMKVIDRGATEAWARHDLDGCVDRLGLPAPLTEALMRVDAEYDDPVATAAAERLATRIAADHPAAEFGDVIRALNNETPAGKLGRAAQLAYDASPLEQAELPGVVAHAARDALEDELLSGLADTSSATDRAERGDDVTVADQLREGARIGDDTYDEVRLTVGRIEDDVRVNGADRIADTLHAQAMMTNPAAGPVLTAQPAPGRPGGQHKARPDRGTGLST